MTSTERIAKARATWVQTDRPEWIAAVKDYARAHYADGKGWDYVIECWDSRDIAEAIGFAKTVKGAIWNVGRAVRAIADHRADIQAEAF
jgi:hypothetical protein